MSCPWRYAPEPWGPPIKNVRIKINPPQITPIAPNIRLRILDFLPLISPRGLLSSTRSNFLADDSPAFQRLQISWVESYPSWSAAVHGAYREVGSMDSLPSFWTVIPGFIAGCLFIGRIARWLQFVRATMGKGPPSWAPDPRPRRWKTLLAIFVYPTPWIAAALAAWAIHHATTSSFTSEWRWFYAAFFVGPSLLMAFFSFKVRQLRRLRNGNAAPPI
jgi:hypothetical protein